MRVETCTKCRTASAQLISDTGRLCAECLQSAIRLKLNKSIKVHFALEHGDVALVAVSGGASSMALAHMLCTFRLEDWSCPQAGKVRAPKHKVLVRAPKHKVLFSSFLAVTACEQKQLASSAQLSFIAAGT
jgi:hypothetical protein